MNYPENINKLINVFKGLPGVGEKGAERIVFALLGYEKEELNKISKVIDDVSINISCCDICGALTNKGECNICSDKKRNKQVICVVEQQKNIYLIEKTGAYNGTYHVLGGLISPINGITPDSINIDSLVKRVKDTKVEEVILALKPGIEGETTALYISKILGNMDIKVTRLAQGMPIGAEMDYIDLLTIQMAMENRNSL